MLAHHQAPRGDRVSDCCHLGRWKNLLLPLDASRLLVGSFSVVAVVVVVVAGGSSSVVVVVVAQDPAAAAAVLIGRVECHHEVVEHYSGLRVAGQPVHLLNSASGLLRGACWGVGHPC